MSEKKEPKTVSHKSRCYASLIFLIAFAIIAITWLILVAPNLQPNQNLISLLIIFLVLGGLAVLPWLPILFPREPPGESPLRVSKHILWLRIVKKKGNP
ncbi:MAG: hypothetical protein ACFE9D_05190 [Promethearchaeota archaeon]